MRIRQGAGRRRAASAARRALSPAALLLCAVLLAGCMLMPGETDAAQPPASEAPAPTGSAAATPGATEPPAPEGPGSQLPEGTPPPSPVPDDDTMPPDMTAAPSGPATPTPQASPPPEDVEGYAVVGRLSIEAIGLELNVLGECSDAALDVAPCLYAGPNSPAYAGNIVITGHNNRDDSHFGKLNELKTGDMVVYTDGQGDVYRYEVYDRETIGPSQVAKLEEYQGDHALSLLTCANGGTSRLLLRCRPAS